MTAKHQPTPRYSQARALLPAPVTCSGFGQAGGLWGAGGGPSRGNRQRFGPAVLWVGFSVVFFGWIFFFSPFTNVFHYNSRVFRHRKDIPDQQHTSPPDNVETSCFHKFSSPKLLRSEEFLSPPPAISSPRRLWLGERAPACWVPAPLPALMPPAPAELGTRSPETPGLRRGGNVAAAPAKGSGSCRQQRWGRQAGSEPCLRGQDGQGRCYNTQGGAGHKAIGSNRGAGTGWGPPGRSGCCRRGGDPQLTCSRQHAARESSRNPSTCRARERQG